MCRSCTEGGRRCQDTWSAEKIAKETRAANARRTKNRAIKREFATTIGSQLGPDAYAAVMKTSPNQLSLVASRVADHSPEMESQIRASVNGKYPGTHNMVVQEIRAESAYLDHDRTGDLKSDPMNVTSAMKALNAVDAAALEQGLVPEDQRADLERELDVRQIAVDLGLGDPNKVGPVTAQQAAFYNGLELDEIAALGRPNERLENKLRAEVFKSANITMSPRASLLDESDEYRNARQLADTVSNTQMAKGLPVAEDVLLKRDEDGTLYYSIDGAHRLPASPHGFVHDEIAKIPYVDEVAYDRFSSPAGQDAMFDRLSKDPHTDLAVEEAAIRTAFTSDRFAGRKITEGENFTFDEGPNVGHAGVTHTQMAATGHRRPGDFDPTSPASPVANRHLRRAGDVRAATQRMFAERQGVADTLDVRNDRRITRAASGADVGGLTRLRTPVAGNADYTADDQQVESGLSAFMAAQGDKTVRSRKNTGRLDTSTFSKAPVGNQDVDLAVARANSYAVAGGPDLAVTTSGQINNAHDTDTCDTAAMSDYLRVRESVGATSISRAMQAKSGSPVSPVTMSSYTSVPEDTDVSELYATGSSHSPSAYVAVASNARKPRRTRGGRTVRMVYTTSTGAQITPQRTIVGPEQTFRVARTDTASDGTVTVHMVEDTVLSTHAPTSND
ncbi:hypothetical protein [Corynebacterium sp. AOP12-C2-36]|uniref:hypothetical protein n=1 Tax=Corynebacterium sp. AOP12-C2-36 TaxID=3457723 RepID=UPI00403381B4